MKVTKNEDEGKMILEFVAGDTFKSAGQLYIVTDWTLPGQLRKCVDLETGITENFAFEQKVTPCIAEVIILNNVDE